MKKVKVCTECGFYNKVTKTECVRCGSRMDGVPITEAEDDATEDPNFGIKAAENAEPENATGNCGSSNGLTVFECVACGESIAFPAGEKVVYCKQCNRMYFPEDAERLSAEPNGGAFVSAETGAGAERAFVFESVSKRGSFVLTFAAERKIFGRSSCDNEFINDNKYISREHFAYFYKDGHAYVVDMSANGTFVNGKRLIKGGEYVLNVGDVLRLCNEEFVVKYAG